MNTRGRFTKRLSMKAALASSMCFQAFAIRNWRGQELEECFDGRSDTVIIVDNKQNSPLIKSRTRMRNAQGDHVTDTQKIRRGSLEISVLVIETNDLEIATQPYGSVVATGSKSLQWHWQSGVVTAIAAPGCKNDKIGFRCGLHVRPNLKCWNGAGAKIFAI